MKYELIVTVELDIVVPPLSPGYDLATWFSPYPGMREHLASSIADGSRDRYCSSNDKVEIMETSKIVHTIYNTKEAAESIGDWMLRGPAVINLEIIERPDL